MLLEIRDSSNRLAWEEFVKLYRPVIYRAAVSQGLQHTDALDLLQTVFVAVANSIARWEEANPVGRFRYWLLRVTRNATLNALFLSLVSAHYGKEEVDRWRDSAQVCSTLRLWR